MLATNMEEMAGAFDARMRHMETDLKKFTTGEQPSHKDLESLSREFIDFKKLIWKTMAMMKSQMELLVQGLDRQETASRRKVLLFHGIAESADTTVEKTILHLLTSQFKMSNISPDQLTACHRLGTNTSKPRPVIVRFAHYSLRNSVWNAKSSLKNTGITASEFLTKPRHDVFIAARKHFGMRQCWTTDGKIIILLPDNKRRRIETLSELKPLLTAFPAEQPTPDKKTPGTSQDKAKASSSQTMKAGKVAEPRARRAVK